MQTELLQELRTAHNRASMVGWDFSELDTQISSEKPWWEFEQDCLQAWSVADHVCDIGTGGGERVLRLIKTTHERGAALPHISATEGWAPNVPVARDNLKDVGVDVHPYKAEFDDAMPFKDGEFDLVMSRHEAIDAPEVARVLRPGGRLLTQQVHSQDGTELREWFGSAALYKNVNAETYVQNLEQAGFEIDQVDDWAGTMRFQNVKALVTYLGFIPWIVPDFEVEKYSHVLQQLNDYDPLTISQRRFRIYATKSSEPRLSSRNGNDFSITW